MKKKIISAVMVAGMALSVCTVSLANSNSYSTADGLKSSGRIIYQEGANSVVIDSGDLYTLAAELDQFKVAAVNQMAALRTYFTSQESGTNLATNGQVNVVHTQPADTVDPLSLGFDTILEGFAASQSIPLVTSEYGYAEGTKLYKTEEGRLVTDSSGTGAQEISIAAATADNLSAGCAAWVNGELLLGTGADNQSYYSTNDMTKLFDSIEVVQNPCTLEKGTYMYIINNASATEHSDLYYIANLSISNDSVNSVTAVTSNSTVKGGSSNHNKVYLGYKIFRIEVNDESADVSITLRASSGASNGAANRMCIKMK